MWVENTNGTFSIAVTELRENAIDRSGQYIANNDASLLIPTDRFTRMLELNVLPIVNDYKPRLRRFNLTIGASPYQFTAGEGIPTSVTRCTPLMGTSSSGYILQSALVSSMKLIEDADIAVLPFVYVRPWLYVNAEGRFDVTAIYDMEVSDGSVVGVQPHAKKYITDLSYAYFLKSLGMKRRAVTETDFPITFNGDELFAEGEKLETETKERLEAASKAFVGWRR